MNKLILLEEIEKKNYHRIGKYICSCGNEFTTRISRVNSEKTKSCGCLVSKKTTERNTIHGKKYTKLYSVYSSMKSRCCNKNHKHYKDYGGRGIYVCDEWIFSFVAFYKWAMNNGYSDGLEIEREDNNDGYNELNCKWATRKEQCLNRRIPSNNKSEYRGVCFKKYKYQAQLTADGKNIYLGTFKNKEDAAIAYNKYIIDNNLKNKINTLKGLTDE